MIRIPRTTTARTVAALAVAVALAVFALSGCSAVSSHSDASAAGSTYGSLPSFLPKDSIDPDGTLDGTVANPAITSEGDSVDAVTPAGTALVSVVGPVVPGEGLPYQADSTTCTWTVTVTAKSGSIAISPSDFTATDHLGNVFRPTFVAGQPTPPTVLEPGSTSTFELRAGMTVGEGLMRWAPAGGGIVASWDFEVEND